MLQQKGKKIKFFFYIFILIILTSTNNYNFVIQNLFDVKYIYVYGFSKEKNELIKSEINKIYKKNIFFLKQDHFFKLNNRNDIKYLQVKKNFPNKIIINFTPAQPICIIKNKDNIIILGDNGKMLNYNLNENNIPIVSGSTDFKNIYNVVNLLKKSNLDYQIINKINFFKSGRFDIILNNDVIIKYPIKYNQEIINYSRDLLDKKNFSNSKIIDLRLKNKIIKYE